MPLEEAARTGGRVTVEDLQRSASMPLEDAEGGRGQTMGALGARASAHMPAWRLRNGWSSRSAGRPWARSVRAPLPTWLLGGWRDDRSSRACVVSSLRPGAGRRPARMQRRVRLSSGMAFDISDGLGVCCCAESAARRAPSCHQRDAHLRWPERPTCSSSEQAGAALCRTPCSAVLALLRTEHRNAAGRPTRTRPARPAPAPKPTRDAQPYPNPTRAGRAQRSACVRSWRRAPRARTARCRRRPATRTSRPTPTPPSPRSRCGAPRAARAWPSTPSTKRPAWPPGAAPQP